MTTNCPSPARVEATDACPFCLESIKPGAKKCKHCGEFLDLALARPPAAMRHRSGLAAVLSLLLPGAGQIYLGRVFSGVCWLMLLLGTHMITYMPDQAPMMVVLHVLCAVSVAITRDRNEGQTPSAAQMFERYLFTFVLLAYIAIAVIAACAVAVELARRFT